MTREEAKQLKYRRSKQSESISFDRLDFMLDEIYDDFESRTCANCKYKDADLCTNIEVNNFFPLSQEGNEFLLEPENFGCNQWKKT